MYFPGSVKPIVSPSGISSAIFLTQHQEQQARGTEVGGMADVYQPLILDIAQKTHCTQGHCTNYKEKQTLPQ